MSAFVRAIVDWKLLLFELVLSNLVVPNQADPSKWSFYAVGSWFLIAFVMALRDATRNKQLSYPAAVRRLRACPAQIGIELAPDTVANERFMRELESLLTAAGWRSQYAGALLNHQAIKGLVVTYSSGCPDSAPYRELARVLSEMGYVARAEVTDDWLESDPGYAQILIAEDYYR